MTAKRAADAVLPLRNVLEQAIFAAAFASTLRANFNRFGVCAQSEDDARATALLTVRAYRDAEDRAIERAARPSKGKP